MRSSAPKPPSEREGDRLRWKESAIVLFLSNQRLQNEGCTQAPSVTLCVPPSSRRKAYYPNLRQGRRFHRKAISSDGVGYIPSKTDIIAKPRFAYPPLRCGTIHSTPNHSYVANLKATFHPNLFGFHLPLADFIRQRRISLRSHASPILPYGVVRYILLPIIHMSRT